MTDMIEWLSGRQGKAVVPLKQDEGFDPEIAREGSFELLDPGVLRRDDARVCLRSRSSVIMSATEGLVGRLPSEAVDAFAVLKLFDRQDVLADGQTTAELYAGLIVLDAALARLQGLETDKFRERELSRKEISPLLYRWHLHERQLYTTRDAPEPRPEPARG